MDEILKIFEIGYFDAINDINNGIIDKKFINIIDTNLLSKIYDLGYIIGFQKYNEYIKNNL